MQEYDDADKDNQISDLEDQVARLESDLDTANEEIDDIRTQLDEKTNKITEYSEDIDYYESSIETVCDYYEDDILNYFIDQTYYKVITRLQSLYMSLLLDQQTPKTIDYFTSSSSKEYLKECLIDTYTHIIGDLLPIIPQSVTVESCSNAIHKYAYSSNSALLENTFFFDLTSFYINEAYRHVIIPLYGMLSEKEKELVKEDHNKSSMMKFLYHVQGHCFINLFDQIVSSFEVCHIIQNKVNTRYRDSVYYNHENLGNSYIKLLSQILKYCCVHYELNSTYFELVNKYFREVNRSNLIQNVIEAVKDNFTKHDKINYIVSMIGKKSFWSFSVNNLKFESFHESCDLNTHKIHFYDGPDGTVLMELFNDYNIKDCSYYKKLEDIIENNHELFDMFSGTSENIPMPTYKGKGTKDQDTTFHVSKHNDLIKDISYYVNQYIQSNASQSVIYYLWCCSVKATYLLTSNLQPCKIVWGQQFANSNKYSPPYVMNTEKSDLWLSTKLLNIPQFLVVLKGVIDQQGNIENPFFNDSNYDLNQNCDDFNHEAYHNIKNDIEDYINTIVTNCEKILKDDTYDLCGSIHVDVELDHAKYAMYTLESIIGCFNDTKTDLTDLNKSINKLKIKV